MVQMVQRYIYQQLKTYRVCTVLYRVGTVMVRANKKQKTKSRSRAKRSRLILGVAGKEPPATPWEAYMAI